MIERLQSALEHVEELFPQPPHHPIPRRDRDRNMRLGFDLMGQGSMMGSSQQ